MCWAFVVNCDPLYYYSLQMHEKTLPCFIPGKGNGIDVKIMKILQNNVVVSKAEDIVRSHVFNVRTKRKAISMCKHESLKQNGKIGSHSCPSFIEDGVPKGSCLLNSLMSDYEVNKDDLLSELQSVRSTFTLAIDHQH